MNWQSFLLFSTPTASTAPWTRTRKRQCLNPHKGPRRGFLPHFPTWKKGQAVLFAAEALEQAHQVGSWINS